MGRPSKGERDQITAKPAKPLGMVIRANADLLHMSYGDYLVHLAAHQLGMPELAPQPGVTGDMLEELLLEPFPQVDQVAPVSPLAMVRPSLRELPTQTQIAS